MKYFKQIPKKKQGMRVRTYLKKATYKELAIFFASTFWSDLEFATVLPNTKNYLDNVKKMLNKKMPEVLEYIGEMD